MFHRKSSQGTGMCHDSGSERQKRNSALVSAHFPLPSSQPQGLTCPARHSEPWPSQHLLSLWRPFPRLALVHQDKDKHFYLTSTQTNRIPLSHPGHQEIFEDTQAVSDHHFYQVGFNPVCAVFQRQGNRRFLLCMSQALFWFAKTSPLEMPSRFVDFMACSFLY